MPKKQNESLSEYRDRIINSISPSYCAAKWYNATTWLGSGTTASCHHPPAHKIPLEEIADNLYIPDDPPRIEAAQRMFSFG